MDPNDSGDPCFERVCEEEFNDIADDRYESPDSAPGSVCSSECSSEEMISGDIGDDSEPDDSPMNVRESSIYPGSTFTNGNFDALLLAFFKKTSYFRICKGRFVEVVGTNSVSYTHLTLPTNREV